MIFRAILVSACLALAATPVVAQTQPAEVPLSEAQETASLQLTDRLNALGTGLLKKQRPKTETEAYDLLKAAYLTEINGFLKTQPASTDAEKVEMVRSALIFVAMNTRYMKPQYKLNTQQDGFFMRFIERFKTEINFSGQGETLSAA